MSALTLDTTKSFVVETTSGSTYVVMPLTDQHGNSVVAVSRTNPTAPERYQGLDWPNGRVVAFDSVELVSRPGHCAALRFRNHADPAADVLTSGLSKLH
jgi:hypothetical protein